MVVVGGGRAAAVLLVLAAALLGAVPAGAPGGPSGRPGGATITTPSLVLTVSAEGNVTAVMDRGERRNRALDTEHKLLYGYFVGGAQAGVTAVEQSGSTIVATFASMGSATVTVEVGISDGDLIVFRVVNVTGPSVESALQQLDFLTLPMQSTFCARTADVPGDVLGVGAYDDDFGVVVLPGELEVETMAQGPATPRCPDVSRAFDANGFERLHHKPGVLRTGNAVVHNLTAADGEIPVDVTLSSTGQANAEITIVEKSSQVLGPFQRKVLKTDDGEAGEAGLRVNKKFVGWIGPYHPSSGTTWAAPGVENGTTVWEAFKFGTVCMENALSDGGYALEQDIELHCDTWDVNSVYGMLLPPSEGGTLSNPKDTALYKPLSPAGLVQGAARWSKLAARCPQIAGVQIDDFLQNYVGTRPYTPPKPVNHTGCAKCPASTPHVYGGGGAGAYCCAVNGGGGHCPAGNGECCLSPGASAGCQGIKHCSTFNSHPACGVKGPHDMLTLRNMRDIKAALQGKAVDENGAVDHASEPTTPHLKLFICWYTHETSAYGWVKDDGLLDVVDGINLWIWEQTTPTPGYTAEVAKARAVIGPNVEMMAAAYFLNSGPCANWCNVEGFDEILQESIELYDKGQLVGMYLFAGSMLARSYMNQSEWDTWALPAKLQEQYYPYLGEADVSVTDAATGKALKNAAVHVTYGGGAFVTRKLTSEAGLITFGGWAGKAKPTPHNLIVSLPGYKNATQTLQIQPQGTIKAMVALTKVEGKVKTTLHKTDDDDKPAELNTCGSDDFFCAEDPAAAPGTDCDEDVWPDLDHGLVCSECKVLVNNMYSTYGGLCDNYCASIGLRCVGAWEERDDTCTVLSVESCSVSIGRTSDAICQCTPGEVSPCRDIGSDCCATGYLRNPIRRESASCAPGYHPSAQPTQYDRCPNFSCLRDHAPPSYPCCDTDPSCRCSIQTSYPAPDECPAGTTLCSDADQIPDVVLAFRAATPGVHAGQVQQFCSDSADCSTDPEHVPSTRPGSLQTLQYSHGIEYTISVPRSCGGRDSNSCGVILDVHGFTMSAGMENANDDMRMKGNSAGYIVVQPSAPDNGAGTPSWMPDLHHPVLIRLLQQIVTLFAADRSKVHVTGFSQGGFASWYILCNAPNLICSAAPLAASGRDSWGGGGYGTQCFMQTRDQPNPHGPEIRRSVFLTNGVYDPLSVISNARLQVADVKRAYSMSERSATVEEGDGHTLSRWSTADINFQYLEHSYSYENRPGSSDRTGHCFPTSEAVAQCDASDRRAIDGYTNHRCCAALTWSDEVIEFFRANPCLGDQDDPVPPPPPPPKQDSSDDSCRYANDGECDEPRYCAVRTDCTDCHSCSLGGGH